MSRTEAAPAHHVSSGEDEESEESGRTRIGSPDAVVGDSAKTAERTEEKVEKTKKKRKSSRSKTRSRSRTRSPSSTRRAKAATFAPAAEQDADARQKKPQLDEAKLQKLEQKVKETKAEIREKKAKEAKEAADAEAAAQAKLEKKREKEQARREKELERDRAADAEAADPTPGEKPKVQQGQQCPICAKWLRSSSDFALSQHLWALHPDEEESIRRSDAHRLVLKERAHSQPRAAEQGQGNKNSQWHGDRRQKSLSRVPDKRWTDNSPDRREPSQARSRRARSGTRHHSRASRRSRSSTGSSHNEGMLAEFFRTTRALSRRAE